MQYGVGDEKGRMLVNFKMLMEKIKDGDANKTTEEKLISRISFDFRLLKRSTYNIVRCLPKVLQF